MALSNIVADAEAKGATPATATPATAQTGAKSNTEALHEKFKEQGHAIRESRSAEEKALEGSKSDKVTFIGCLGDPATGQFRKSKGENVPSYKVVGYRFKALEDMQVPVAKLKVGFKNPLDTEEITMRNVKANEEFDLNSFETGVLAAQIEYAGRFTGEGTNVSLTVKFSKDRPDPLPVLKALKGSVKENMIMVATNIGDETKKQWKVKDEFADKFDVLYMKKSAGKPSQGGNTKGNKESTADVAAAFLQYIKSRQ